MRPEQRVIQFALKPTIITSAASRRRAKSRADVALKIYGHRPGHASCMNGGAACNNSTPRPHLGHFPSAVWQGTTTERTAVLRCGGISGSCAVDISPLPPPPLFAATPSFSISLTLAVKRHARIRTHMHTHSLSLPLSFTHPVSTSLPFASPSVRYIHALPLPRQPPLAEREPEPRERRALIYRPHTLHWMERNMSAEKGNNH